MSNNKSGFLNKMTSWFEKWIGPIAEFTNTNIYLTSISDAFTMQMPLIIVGSFALLLNLTIYNRVVNKFSIYGCILNH